MLRNNKGLSVIFCDLAGVYAAKKQYDTDKTIDLDGIEQKFRKKLVKGDEEAKTIFLQAIGKEIGEKVLPYIQCEYDEKKDKLPSLTEGFKKAGYESKAEELWAKWAISCFKKEMGEKGCEEGILILPPKVSMCKEAIEGLKDFLKGKEVDYKMELGQNVDMKEVIEYIQKQTNHGYLVSYSAGKINGVVEFDQEYKIKDGIYDEKFKEDVGRLVEDLQRKRENVIENYCGIFKIGEHAKREFSRCYPRTSENIHGRV